MEKRVYLDSSILLPLIDPYARLDQIKNSKRIIGRLNYFRKRKEAKTIASQIVVGEVFSKIYKRIGDQASLSKALTNLIALREHIDECPPLNKDVVNIALELAKRDYSFEISFQDAIIISHAIYDPLSTHFITTDADTLKSIVLTELVKELYQRGERKSRLIVTDSLR
jgi:hypothetical protein